MNDSPKNLGYRMPAEWERHSSVWLAWPYDKVSFPKRVEKVEEVYGEIIGNIYKSERVELLVAGEEMKGRAVGLLKKIGVDLNKVNIHIADYADVWFRDFGPSFLVKEAGKGKSAKELAIVDWTYNAYAKWPELLKDDKIPIWMNEKLELPYFNPGIVLEGGAVEVNGRGTLITTEECLLNENRNPDLEKGDMEKYLSVYLGVKNVIWLTNGLAFDSHTDGHIDNIARFANSNTILYSWDEEEASDNYPAQNENLEILKRAKSEAGKKFKLVKLPLPRLKDDEGKEMAVSYANFYIANKVVLVPVFGHNNDKVALAIIREAFPDRKVIGINCADLIYGGGTIHCATREQPAV